MQPNNDISFETALGERVEDMLDACTRCGKCVEVCPSVKPAGIADARPERHHRRRARHCAQRRRARGVAQMGRVLHAERGMHQGLRLRCQSTLPAGDGAPRHREGRQANYPNGAGRAWRRYRDLGRDVTVLSRLQLDGEVLERLGQKSASVSTPAEAPDFVFYTGCNVLKTPHIALLALDIMDVLGVTYQVMGGPSHCCGIMQLRAGDIEMSGRMGSSSIEKLSHSKSGQVISWCPSCYVQFTELTLPTIERQRGSRPFEMTPFMRFLDGRLAQLKPHLQRPGRNAGRAAPASRRRRRRWKPPLKSCGRSPASNSST